MKKIYTAFVSSTFKSLRDERKEVIDSLLDFRVLPIGMEHFTVSTSGEFSDIQEIIDDSDFFVMLMGKNYGSCDEKGISWTEREYEYACLKKKPIVVIICDELIPNLAADPNTLDEQERKQVEFSKKINYSRMVTPEFSIKTIVGQFLTTYNFSKCIGWSRIENISMTEEQLKKWRKENKVFEIGGNWYHVHLSNVDEKYIRIGTVVIQQDFSPDKYKKLEMTGYNFGISYYDVETKVLKEKKLESSMFVGEYTLQENGEIFGVYNSKRDFEGQFQEHKVCEGPRRGIHDFTINVVANETTNINGKFHDEAPSIKHGRIFLFRSKEDRDAFVLENCSDVIEKR